MSSSGYPLQPPAAQHWAALHVRSRSEKVVASWIAQQGGTTWLALAPNRRTYDSRVRTSWMPVFPGYVFYDASTFAGVNAYRTRHVARVMLPPTPYALAYDLQNVGTAMANEALLRPAGPLVEDEPRVRVAHGRLAGVYGHLRRQGEETHLVLPLAYLGVGAATEVDEAAVQPA